MDISKLMRAFITVTENQGKNEKRIYKLDVAGISYIEARYDNDEELAEMRKDGDDLSTIHFLVDDDEREVEVQQSPDEIEALIEQAEDKRMARLNKFRLGIR